MIQTIQNFCFPCLHRHLHDTIRHLSLCLHATISPFHHTIVLGVWFPPQTASAPLQPLNYFAICDFDFPSGKMAETPSGIDQTNDNRNSGRQHASPPSFPTSPTSNSQKPRLSKEFVELQSCPLPELAVDPECAPEPLSNLDKLDNTDHDDASTYPVVPVEPDVGDRRPSAVVYAEPDRSWISKHKSWVILGLIVAVIIMTGVTVGVVITERHNSSGGGGSR